MTIHERHDDFIGKEELLARHRQQVEDFERWARAGDWRRFHSSHYDWWAFPIAQPSQSWGQAYAVPWDVVLELREDAAFLASLGRAIELLTTAWGWDLAGERPLPDPKPDQAWAHWPIRLKKATVSARLFGLEEQVAGLVVYARWLDGRGELQRYRRFFRKVGESLGDDQPRFRRA
jgi:hypothetical protein